MITEEAADAISRDTHTHARHLRRERDADATWSQPRQTPCISVATRQLHELPMGDVSLVGDGTEYRYCFDKTHGTEHRLADVFAEFCEPERYKLWARVEHTPHPQCFGAWTHKTKEDWPVTAYRSYMRDYKQHQMEMKWTRRHTNPVGFERRQLCT